MQESIEPVSSEHAQSSAQPRFLGQIVTGMVVVDRAGNKVGTIANVYRNDLMDMTGRASDKEELIEIKSGFLGLGKHYYVPLDAIASIDGNRIRLDRSKEDLDNAGMSQRPDHVPEQ